MKKYHLSRVAAAVLSLLLLLLPVLTACSDQVLNPDGTVGTTGTKETSVLVIETEPETETKAPAITISDESDADPYAGEPHVLCADFLKTGSSDAILLRIDGKTLLVDTGETDDAALIKNALRSAGVERIDVLIFTHYDNDHIGAAVQILNDFPVGDVYMPDYVRSSSLYRKLSDKLAVLTDTGIHRLHDEDVELTLGSASIWINATGLPGHEAGVTVGADENNPDTKENDFSLITSVTFGSVSLLLCGDAERARMGEFNAKAAARGIRRYSLIKIPHHGASADKELLSAIDTFLPRFCVVCADSAETVQKPLETKMKSVGAGRYYTCDGTVRFATNGTSMTVSR